MAYHPRAGLDFPTIILALLRQDHDVMMIGEIRDAPTAQLAIQAAQTGHLVLSTLHTRSAHGALSRLKNLRIDHESLESYLLSVSSQRLIRRTCPQQRLETNNSSTGPSCKGSGYFGCIGAHEVLSRDHLFGSALSQLNMYKAGLTHIQAGLINQASLNPEVGEWH